MAGTEDDLLFSPNCWRVRMALAHKGLPVEIVPWRFTEKTRIAFSGQGLVPVIRDGDRVVHDSWAIAVYLDETYPDNDPVMTGIIYKRSLKVGSRRRSPISNPSSAAPMPVPQWYADAGLISLYYANHPLLPARTRVFVDFVVDAFRRERLAERFAGSLV